MSDNLQNNIPSFDEYIFSRGEKEKWQYTSNEIKMLVFDWRLNFAFLPIIFGMFFIWSYVISFTVFSFCQILRFYGITVPQLVQIILFRLSGKKARANYKYENRRYS